MTVIDPPQHLVETVVGPVLLPGEPGFADETAGFNLATTHTPDVAVGATCAADVVAAVRWAAASGLPVAVQATGHGANLAVDRGVLVNTRRMNGVVIDPEARTATVGAGAKWSDLLAVSLPHGLIGLHGSSSDVGVVGYTLGGGLPLLGRRYGFAANRVRSFEVVTGEGELRQVDSEHEGELFWALRGGKGNVGIVTSLVCDLLPFHGLYGGGVFYAGVHAAVVLAAYRAWTATVPTTMCTALTLLRLPPMPDIPEPLRGQFVVHLSVAFVGSTADGDRLLAPMRATAPAIIDTVGEMDYADVDRIFDDPTHPVPAQEGCTLLRELTPDALDTLLGLAGPQAQLPLIMVQLRHLGGALGEPPEVADAVTGRDAQFALSTIGMLVPPIAAAVPEAIRSVLAGMEPYSTGRSMVNLHGTPGDSANRARAWDAPTLARLQQAKRRYDASNLFRFGHAVAGRS